LKGCFFPLKADGQSDRPICRLFALKLNYQGPQA
jgi:hypothetical protein